MRGLEKTRYAMLRRMQREYHRNHPWRLSHGGLYVPHAYPDRDPNALSWWDDVGFILNKRRIIVWWQHPRHAYSDALEEQSWQEAGNGPKDDWLIHGGTRNYRKIGRARKKLVSITCREPSEEQKMHYDHFRNIRERLSVYGIDLVVSPSWKQYPLTWAMGVDLIAPLEVRDEAELTVVANLARRLIPGQTTLEAEFSGYRYGKDEWLREQRKTDSKTLVASHLLAASGK